MAGQKREALGTNVVPSNYKLLLDTNLKTFKYRGTETISVRIAKPSKSITLNAKYIRVDSASILAGGISHHAQASYDRKYDRITLTISKKVSGQAKIQIRFKGENQYNMLGFYRSKYTNKGKEGWILTTQFEAVSARNAFPCFDEPSLKASFDLSLVVDSNLMAVSNMPIKKEEAAGNGRTQVTFGRTPTMSTYLLYMGVGPFEHISWRSKGLSFRILTVPGKSSRLQLAKEFATRSMDFYQTYFRVNYPLPKIDFLAIPDFQAGAMENWGAITARELGLLGDKSTTSVPVMRYIAVIISHELAHQWFGDLVTMQWWNDLWLNESFATFMEEKTLEALYPKWKMCTNHIVNDSAGAAMVDDQLRTTHPIHVQVNSPSEIEEILDNISYAKGAAVLRMFEDYVTPEVFRKGLKIYFAKHAYSNTVKEDLWNAIAATGEAKARQLPGVASFWIENAGFPIIHVGKPRNGSIELRQERFTILPYAGPQKSWPIPVRYLTDKGEGFIMLKEKSQTIRVPGAKFIKLNLGQKGFYRVSYEKENLAKLGEAIRSGRLDSLDAWGIINDLSALARSCRIKVPEILDFIEKYCMECDYPLNAAIAGYFSALSLRFYDKGPIYKRAKRLEASFSAKLLKKLGWEKKKDEPPYLTSLRSAAIATLGTNGDRKVIAKCRAMFKQYTGSGKKPDADLKVAVYRTIAYNGGIREFKKFISLYGKSTTPDDQRALFAALGSFNSARINAKALDFSISKHIRPQDMGILTSSVASNPEGKPLILDWTKKNWKTILKTFKDNSSLIVDFVENLGILQTKRDLAEVKTFFSSKQNYVSDINRALKNTLEFIESNERFVEYNS